MKRFTVSEMTFKGRSRSLDRLDFYQKSKQDLCSYKTDEMTLKIDQGHW